MRLRSKTLERKLEDAASKVEVTREEDQVVVKLIEPGHVSIESIPSSFYISYVESKEIVLRCDFDSLSDKFKKERNVLS